jgi:hypothetical protein
MATPAPDTRTKSVSMISARHEKIPDPEKWFLEAELYEEAAFSERCSAHKNPESIAARFSPQNT